MKNLKKFLIVLSLFLNHNPAYSMSKEVEEIDSPHLMNLIKDYLKILKNKDKNLRNNF